MTLIILLLLAVVSTLIAAVFTFKTIRLQQKHINNLRAELATETDLNRELLETVNKLRGDKAALKNELFRSLYTYPDRGN